MGASCPTNLFKSAGSRVPICQSSSLLPAPLYSSAPGLITPLFGKPGWFRSVVGDDSPAPTLPAPDQIVRASRQLSEVLPPATLQWRLQVLLTDGVARVNRALEQASSSSSQLPWASSTLLLAGSADAVLPSTAEGCRLAALLPGSTSKVLPGALPRRFHRPQRKRHIRPND